MRVSPARLVAGLVIARVCVSRSRAGPCSTELELEELISGSEDLHRTVVLSSAGQGLPLRDEGVERRPEGGAGEGIDRGQCPRAGAGRHLGDQPSVADVSRDSSGVVGHVVCQQPGDRIGAVRNLVLNRCRADIGDQLAGDHGGTWGGDHDRARQTVKFLPRVGPRAREGGNDVVAGGGRGVRRSAQLWRLPSHHRFAGQRRGRAPLGRPGVALDGSARLGQGGGGRGSAIYQPLLNRVRHLVPQRRMPARDAGLLAEHDVPAHREGRRLQILGAAAAWGPRWTRTRSNSPPSCFSSAARVCGGSGCAGAASPRFTIPERSAPAGFAGFFGASFGWGGSGSH